MMDDTFTPEESAQWEAMRNEASMPEPEPAPPPEPKVEAPVAAEPELPLTPEPEPAAAAEPAEPKSVPLATLLEERREWQAKIDKIMARLEAGPAQPKTDVAQPRQIDPKNLTVEDLQYMAERQIQMDRQAEEQHELAAVADFGSRHATEFKKTTPDFDDAYGHLRNARAQQLISQGAVQSPQELNATLRAEEAQILRMCAQWGVNPAGFVYNLAVNAGYQKAAPVAETPVTPPRGADGKFLPAKAPEAPQKPDAKEKLKMAAEGQERGANPVAGAGAGTGGPIDLRALANMDGDDFDKATDGKAWKKLWGA